MKKFNAKRKLKGAVFTAMLALRNFSATSPNSSSTFGSTATVENSTATVESSTTTVESSTTSVESSTATVESSTATVECSTTTVDEHEDGFQSWINDLSMILCRVPSERTSCTKNGT